MKPCMCSNHLARRPFYAREVLLTTRIRPRAPREQFIISSSFSSRQIPLGFFAVWMSRTLESQTCSKDALLPAYKHRRKCMGRAHKFQVSANWLYPRDLRASESLHGTQENRVGRSAVRTVSRRERINSLCHTYVYLRLSFSQSSYTNLIHPAHINLRGAH